MIDIGNGHRPAAIGVALDGAYLGAEVKGEAVAFLQGGHQLTSDLAEVDVRPQLGTGGGNPLLRVTPLHYQRGPARDLCVVFTVANAAEEVALLKRSVAGAQEVDVLFPPHKAHVWHGVNKGAGIVQHARFHLVSPELAGEVKRLVNFDGLLDAYATVGLSWRIVQFH